MIIRLTRSNLLDSTSTPTRHEYEWKGLPLNEYLPLGCEWVVNLNGEDIYDFNIIPPDGSQIIISPKPEVEAIATWVFSAIAGSTAVMTTGMLYAVTALSYVVAVGVVMAGGMLINSFLAPQTPNTAASGTAESSPTYSWQGATTMPRIGTPIPVLYGKHTLSGNIIQRRIEFVGDDQYLYLLLALCEGEIKDVTIDNIKLNNTDLENFSDVEWFFRNGTLEQEVIPYFGDTETPNNFSVKCLNNTPVIRQTIGNAIEAFKVAIQFPNGLYYSNDKGGLDTRAVDYRIEYRKVGDVAWLLMGNFTASAAQNTSINKEHRIDNLPYGQYEAKITRLTVDNINTRQQDDMYLVNIGEIIYDDLLYPGISLFGIKIKASDQLSGGDPTLSIICERTDIEIFNESGISQGFKSLSNPAWCAYDILTNKEYGAGYASNRIDYIKFLEWANWNNELVDDGFGGSEKRNTFNGVFDAESNVWDCLAKVCTTGRAGMFIKGTKYVPIIDKPSQPVQMFSMGNIVKSSFSTSYIGTEDLATEVEIQYINKDNGYVKDTLSVVVPQFFDQTQYSNKATISQMGITSKSQAYRAGRYMLACNKNQYRTVSFEAGVDAIACSVGDVIYVSHDVPAWGISGRIESGTLSTVTFDQEVTMQVGKTYRLLLRHSDSDTIDKRDIVFSGTQTTKTVTVNVDFSSLPKQYDVFSFGETGKEAQLFRVISITRTTDQTRKLTCIDYNESVLADATTIIPTNSASMALSPSVTNLTVGERTQIINGVNTQFLTIDWTVNTSAMFSIYISSDNLSYTKIVEDHRSISYEYQGHFSINQGYYIKVCAKGIGSEYQSLANATTQYYQFLGTKTAIDSAVDEQVEQIIVDVEAINNTIGNLGGGEVTTVIKGVNLPTTGQVEGLNITKNYMGYYDSSLEAWKSYIDNTGQFLFQKDISNYIKYDTNVFEIKTENFSVDSLGNANFSGILTTQDVDGNTVLIDGGKITSTASNGDKVVLSQSDLLFYKSGSITASKYLKQLDVGIAINNTTVTINNFFSEPKIIVSPSTVDTYNKDNPTRTQRLNCYYTNLTGSMITGIWTFKPIMQLILGGSNAYIPNAITVVSPTTTIYSAVAVGATIASGAPATFYTNTYITQSNTTNITIDGTTAFGPYYISGDVTTAYSTMVLSLQVSSDNINWVTINTVTRNRVKTQYPSYSLTGSVSAGTYYVRVMIVASYTSFAQGTITIPIGGNTKNTFNISTVSSGFTIVDITGTLNWIAIG